MAHFVVKPKETIFVDRTKNGFSIYKINEPNIIKFLDYTMFISGETAGKKAAGDVYKYERAFLKCFKNIFNNISDVIISEEASEEITRLIYFNRVEN